MPTEKNDRPSSGRFPAAHEPPITLRMREADSERRGQVQTDERPIEEASRGKTRDPIGVVQADEESHVEPEKPSGLDRFVLRVRETARPGDGSTRREGTIERTTDGINERASVSEGWRDWLEGARPRTLPSAVVPVLVGTATAVYAGEGSWIRFLLALTVGVGMQVGVNYANDYSDGVRGTDDVRTGPKRLVASGARRPHEVRQAAMLSFAVAATAGVILSLLSSPWLLLFGAFALLAAWGYSGGKRPYGYYALGEFMVFIFFGLLATIGTSYVQVGSITILAVVAAVPVGLWSVSMLIVNNLRDIPSDTATNKRTLAVHLGDAGTRQFFYICLGGAFLVMALTGFGDRLHMVWVSLVSVLWLWPVLRPILRGATGLELVPVLGAMGRAQLVAGSLFALGLLGW